MSLFHWGVAYLNTALCLSIKHCVKDCGLKFGALARLTWPLVQVWHPMDDHSDRERLSSSLDPTLGPPGFLTSLVTGFCLPHLALVGTSIPDLSQTWSPMSWHDKGVKLCIYLNGWVVEIKRTVIEGFG